jgi:hypothetical protein
LVLLDVEGLFTKKTEAKFEHDLKLFTLAVLCSSVFIYNTKNVIDSSALDGLSIMTSQITSEFMGRTNDKRNENHLSGYFPILVWAIRDWFPEFEVPGNEDPSSDEYMEYLLQEGECKVILDHFRERKCFAFPAPVSNNKKMKSLGTIGEDELDEDFLEETKKLLTFIKQKADSKKIHGKSLNGKSFSELLKSLTMSIREKNINIQSTSEYVESSVNRDAFEKAMKKYQDMFEKEVSTFPGNFLFCYMPI